MTAEHDTIGLREPRRGRTRAADAGRTLRNAALRIAELRHAGSRLRTSELVALLLSHGARSWRASQPPANVRLRVFAPDGHVALRLDLPAVPSQTSP